MVVWTQEPAEVTVSEATTAANLRQWQAVLAADEWQRAWEAMAEPEEPAAEEPKRIQCDGCNVVVLEEETVGGGYCRRICFDCADTEQGERWEPEEWGFDGEGDRQ